MASRGMQGIRYLCSQARTAGYGDRWTTWERRGAVCAATDASHWQNLNGSLGSLAEVDSLGQAASTAANMLVGLGANGFAGIVGASATAGDWNEILGGEGGPVAVDPTVATNSWYANNGAGVSVFHCSQTTACTAAQFGTAPAIGEAQVSYDGLAMPYPAEIKLDPMNASENPDRNLPGSGVARRMGVAGRRRMRSLRFSMGREERSATETR